MTTKAYLGQALRFERMTRNKMNELRRYREIATSTTVSDNGDRVQTSSSKDRLGSIVAKLVDLESEIDDLTMKREKIIRQIENMEDADAYQILYSHYVDECNIYEIRNIIHCSRTQIYKLFEKAIEDFEKKYGKTYAND